MDHTNRISPETDQEEIHPLLRGLNAVQREAVCHRDGPLLLFAGAGSGKTRVLTHRIAYLISEYDVAPRHLLAVTFTNKAAREMKLRIAHLMGETVVRHLSVGTFHAICVRILREFAEQAGFSRDFLVYDESDQRTLVKECLKELNLDEKKFEPRAILSHISRAKERLITPEMWKHHFHGYFEKICGRVYPLYQEKLRQNNALDFDDLLGETVSMCRSNPEALRRLQDRHRYLLVDEYQDVNQVQYELLVLLAGARRNLCVVGDDDQSIYMFRGADVRLILQFESDYPDAKVLKLEQNYRSTQTILEAAHSVVRCNQSRKDKKLWTANPAGAPLQKVESENEQEEAVWIAQTIREAVQVGRRHWSDYAVLYRTNVQSRAIEDVFVSWKIPFRIVGGLRFYERKEVKDALAYLRAIQNPRDSISLRRILNVPPRGIGASTLAALDAAAQESGRTFWETLEAASDLQTVQPRMRARLAEFTRLIAALRESREGRTITDLTLDVLGGSGYITSLEEERTRESENRLENVRELLSVTRQYDAEHESRSLETFLEEIALVADIDVLDESADAVVLMTLHAAKGLEFPAVFMVGMEERIFPHARSLESDLLLGDGRHIEEERRLCYVGITRAQEELYLSSALRRNLFGGIAYNPPSRFLREIPRTLFQKQKAKRARGPALSTYDPDAEERPHGRQNASPRQEKLWVPAPPLQEQPLEFRVAQKVRHPQFGVGVVIDVACGRGDTVVEAVFPGVGQKKIQVSLTKLEKVN